MKPSCIISKNLLSNGIRTDSGTTWEPTGALAFGPGLRDRDPLGKFPSLFQAELHAIERFGQSNLGRWYKSRLRSSRMVKQLSRGIEIRRHKRQNVVQLPKQA